MQKVFWQPDNLIEWGSLLTTLLTFESKQGAFPHSDSARAVMTQVPDIASVGDDSGWAKKASQWTPFF